MSTLRKAPHLPDEEERVTSREQQHVSTHSADIFNLCIQAASLPRSVSHTTRTSLIEASVGATEFQSKEHARARHGAAAA